MKKNVPLKVLGVACALVWMAAGSAQAQVAHPLSVGNVTAARDLRGRNLPGTWGASGTASRVEIRRVGAAIVAPDPLTGEGNEAVNPLFLLTYLGNNVIGANPGTFSETFEARLPTNTWFFARVYDAPSASAATYYANSARFKDVPLDQFNVVSTLEVVFQAMNRVDGLVDLDTDGDGIPDHIELDMGLDPNSPDTDGDGYADGFEVNHSAFLNPSRSDRPIVELGVPGYEGNPPVQTGPHTVSWKTIPLPGMEYRLEYTDALPYEEAFTTNIWSGATTETNLEIDVDGWVTNSFIQGFFRVWAVSPASP